MANCGLCSAENRKLFKRLYINTKVYVCGMCAKDYKTMLDVPETSDEDNKIVIKNVANNLDTRANIR